MRRKSPISESGHIPVGKNHNLRLYVGAFSQTPSEDYLWKEKFSHCTIFYFKNINFNSGRHFSRASIELIGFNSFASSQSLGQLIDEFLLKDDNIYYFPFQVSDIGLTKRQIPEQVYGPQKSGNVLWPPSKDISGLPGISLNNFLDFVYSHADPLIELFAVAATVDIVNAIVSINKYLPKTLYVVLFNKLTKETKADYLQLFMFDAILRNRGFRLASLNQAGKVIYCNQQLLRHYPNVKIDFSLDEM
jgi:hypothetical protein